MTTRSSFLLSTVDGLQLKGNIWQGKVLPTAIIVFVHSIGDHIGRYHHSASFFSQRGMTCIGINFRGEGSSEGKRGDTLSFETYHNDLEVLLTEVTANYPTTPVFLYGHGYGSNIILEYTLKNKYPIKGIILSSPLTKLSTQVSHLERGIIKLMSYLAPSQSYSFALNIQGISRDVRVRKDYLSDPLITEVISYRSSHEILKHIQKIQNITEEVSCPTLIMYGTADKIAEPEATEQLYNRLKGNITRKKWEGFFHELHNELGKEQVLSFVNSWIQQSL